MKKRLLVITPRFPYPVIGGDRLRIYYLCKVLSDFYDISLLSLCESREEMNMRLPEDGIFQRVDRHYLPKWRSFFNCMMALPGKEPLQVAYYASSKFGKKVDDLLKKHDVSLAHLIRVGAYLSDSKKPKVLEMTDAISMNYERVGNIAKSSGIKNFIYSMEYKRLKHYERRLAKEFDLSILVSAVDKDYLFDDAELVKQKVLVCSNGVSLDSLPYGYEPDGKTIIFIGNMNTVQNLDAARWFASKVMPLLETKGNFVFKVIGRMKESHRQEFKKYVNTITTGGVDDVAVEAKGASVGICPMRIGAGVQNKVLEYMALGVPAVTSPIGLEGIDAVVGKDILVADKVEEYVEIIVKACRNPSWARMIGLNGCNYVRCAHTWEGKLEPLIERLKCLSDTKSH